MVVNDRSFAVHARTFQYSLCRVVLMVFNILANAEVATDFQYSLCRVVLMVRGIALPIVADSCLSVLALSSRFDGHPSGIACVGNTRTFSTRSVESF